MDVAAILLALTRGLHVAATLSVLGAALARAYLVPPVLARLAAVEARAIEARMRQLLRGAVLFAVLAGLLWLPFLARDMAGAPSLTAGLAAIPDVLFHTRVGWAIMARLALLLLASLVYGAGRSPFLALCAAELAAVATALQIAMGHAAAAEDWDLPESEILHLLAAGAWLGGLMPLLVLVRRLPPQLAALAARRFSPLGIACVLLLAFTAVVQVFLLVGGIAGLVGTDYGHVALAKLGLFLALLLLAALNRSLLTPALAGKRGLAARTHLLRSIGVETALGLLVLLAASWLANLPPGTHEQPDWPFALRPSLAALAEPELRGEILLGLAMVAAALLLVGSALVWRRLRWLGPAIAGLLGLLALPHLGLLLVEAYPTSYYTSPTGFSAASIAAGAALYPVYCASCHGAEGRGDGPEAKSLTLPPADLTAPHLFAHSDGELFWWLSHGMENAEGRLVMPGFEDVLGADQRWQLIDFIRARNAGLAATDHWTTALRAPDFTARCADGRVIDLAGLRGEVVRLVAGAPSVAAAPDGLITIRLDGDAAAGGCIATGDALRLAYGLVAGRAPDALAGCQFLIDGAGWLRALWRPGDPPGWTAPQPLAALVRRVAAAPLAPVPGGHLHH
jgi:putative copper export protein/mono/diheme cytochrome c family protein